MDMRSREIIDTVDQPATILLVDDEQFTRTSLRLRLERLGYHILEAENGRQGLDILHAHSIDLVITDWMMPEMDGLGLCEAIKADATLRSTYIILMTALDKPNQVAQGLSCGADDFFPKSVSNPEIIARVNAGLRTVRLIQELGNSYQLISQQQAELGAELQSAAEFVASLLPRPGNPTSGFQLAWQYLPSLKLGGDFFQIFPWDEEHVVILIMDMSGHGIGPALRAVSLARSFQPEYLAQTNICCDPGRILDLLNRQNPITDRGEYFTIWLGCLHLSTWELSYATAGHPSAILTRQNGRMEMLGTPSWPIGFGTENTYEAQRVTLCQGDRLYLFSDGIYEATSPEGTIWGREGLESACQTVHAKPLEDSLSLIVQQGREWQKKEGFGDDVALVGIECRG